MKITWLLVAFVASSFAHEFVPPSRATSVLGHEFIPPSRPESVLAHEFIPPSLRMLSFPNNFLIRRQGCDVGEKGCGIGCIPTSYTCCPDLAGGCDPTENCQLGNNGKYGCCPKGEVCTGGGGAITTGGGGAATCSVGLKTCGSYCITSSYQCCPDLQGGCNVATATCLSKAAGGYGCCALTASGNCVGAAGYTSSTIVVAPTTTGGGGVGTCSVGLKTCGSYCITSSYQCCPDLQGGCNVATATCLSKAAGGYGCCALTASGNCIGAAGYTSSFAAGPTTTGGFGGGTCSVGLKTCGSYCITSSYQCCPDLQGGCNVATATCLSKAAGGYGCCALTASGNCIGAAGYTSTAAGFTPTTNNVAPTSTRVVTVTSSPTPIATASGDAHRHTESTLMVLSAFLVGALAFFL